MLSIANRLLSGRSSALISLLCLVMLGIIGALDYLTGYELSFSIFYLLPIVIATWYAHRRIGIVFCGLCAVVWLTVDQVSDHPYSQAWIPFWNTCVRLTFFLVTSHLLAEIQARLEYEKKLAMTDGLTRLFNARAFKDLSQRQLQLAVRYKSPVVLGYIDLDNFKTVNDRMGHSEGDRVLEAVSRALQHSVRVTDIVGRLGGDEFALLLPETGLDGARALFARIRDELQQCREKGGWPIGFSIGVAVFSTAPAAVDEALKAADALMYRIKKTGKNDIVFEEVDAA